MTKKITIASHVASEACYCSRAENCTSVRLHVFIVFIII